MCLGAHFARLQMEVFFASSWRLPLGAVDGPARA